jgi:chemotaxis response regulator CheB
VELRGHATPDGLLFSMRFQMVAVAASSGGLQALSALVAALPDD